MENTRRPRRARINRAMRDLVEENQLSPKDLIAPLFVIEGTDKKETITSMPGKFRLSIDLLLEEVAELKSLGVNCISLFPALDDSLKTKMAEESYNPDGLFQRAIKEVKNKFPETLIMSDVAMDPYSSDGHDGIVNDKTGEILNDETLEILGKMALSQAAAGSDIVGPSDMMDHRVAHLRNTLDGEGFKNVSIMSYTAKYASAFYGPFRDALESAPKWGDKKTYQMNPANWREALLELEQDEIEGADILMVKPGQSYLDIVARMREATTLPIAAYQVSGTYAMVKAAGEKGWIDEESVMMEMLLGFKRAGADMILTYFSKEAAKLMN